jgi:prepilin-type N-terminal cleavage/methylation domain-containing protein
MRERGFTLVELVVGLGLLGLFLTTLLLLTRTVVIEDGRDLLREQVANQLDGLRESIVTDVNGAAIANGLPMIAFGGPGATPCTSTDPTTTGATLTVDVDPPPPGHGPGGRHGGHGGGNGNGGPTTYTEDVYGANPTGQYLAHNASGWILTSSAAGAILAVVDITVASTPVANNKPGTPTVQDLGPHFAVPLGHEPWWGACVSSGHGRGMVLYGVGFDLYDFRAGLFGPTVEEESGWAYPLQLGQP